MLGTGGPRSTSGTEFLQTWDNRTGTWREMTDMQIVRPSHSPFRWGVGRLGERVLGRVATLRTVRHLGGGKPFYCLFVVADVVISLFRVRLVR